MATLGPKFKGLRLCRRPLLRFGLLAESSEGVGLAGGKGWKAFRHSFGRVVWGIIVGVSSELLGPGFRSRLGQVFEDVSDHLVPTTTAGGRSDGPRS